MNPQYQLIVTKSSKFYFSLFSIDVLYLLACIQVENPSHYIVRLDSAFLPTLYGEDDKQQVYGAFQSCTYQLASILLNYITTDKFIFLFDFCRKRRYEIAKLNSQTNYSEVGLIRNRGFITPCEGSYKQILDFFQNRNFFSNPRSIQVPGLRYIGWGIFANYFNIDGTEYIGNTFEYSPETQKMVIRHSFSKLPYAYLQFLTDNAFKARDINELHKILAELFWLICAFKPLDYGDPSVAESCIRAIYYNRGYIMPPWKRNIIPWVEATLCFTIEQFQLHFLTLFECDFISHQSNLRVDCPIFNFDINFPDPQYILYKMRIDSNNFNTYFQFILNESTKDFLDELLSELRYEFFQSISEQLIPKLINCDRTFEIMFPSWDSLYRVLDVSNGYFNQLFLPYKKQIITFLLENQDLCIRLLTHTDHVDILGVLYPEYANQLEKFKLQISESKCVRPSFFSTIRTNTGSLITEESQIDNPVDTVKLYKLYLIQDYFNILNKLTCYSKEGHFNFSSLSLTLLSLLIKYHESLMMWLFYSMQYLDNILEVSIQKLEYIFQNTEIFFHINHMLRVPGFSAYLFNLPFEKLMNFFEHPYSQESLNMVRTCIDATNQRPSLQM